jgi:hypothetical protein
MFALTRHLRDFGYDAHLLLMAAEFECPSAIISWASDKGLYPIEKDIVNTYFRGRRPVSLISAVGRDAQAQSWFNSDTP